MWPVRLAIWLAVRSLLFSGSYTDSCGSMHVRNTIAKSISLRDGGVPSSPEQVFITVDTQRALMVHAKIIYIITSAVSNQRHEEIFLLWSKDLLLMALIWWYDKVHLLLPNWMQVMLRLLCPSEGVSAVMIPDPAPHTLTRLLDRMGVVPVTYQLREQSGWSFGRAELNRDIQASRGRCFPRAIYISNPGNPTGTGQYIHNDFAGDLIWSSSVKILLIS